MTIFKRLFVDMAPPEPVPGTTGAFLLDEKYSRPLSELKNIGSIIRSARAESLDNFHFPEKCAFVIGHESEGLTPPWDRSCDVFLRIPISPGTDSLNAGVAAGIFFHAFYRVK